MFSLVLQDFAKLFRCRYYRKTTFVLRCISSLARVAKSFTCKIRGSNFRVRAKRNVQITSFSITSCFHKWYCSLPRLPYYHRTMRALLVIVLANHGSWKTWSQQNISKHHQGCFISKHHQRCFISKHHIISASRYIAETENKILFW